MSCIVSGVRGVRLPPVEEGVRLGWRDRSQEGGQHHASQATSVADLVEGVQTNLV